MNANNQNQNIPEAAKRILKEKGIDPDTVNNGDVNSLIKNLNATDAEKINRLLSDREALERLLNSEKAKAIMKKFFGAK